MINTIGIDSLLWPILNRSRDSHKLEDHKYRILGLIFLRYLSDAFEEIYTKLKTEEVSGKDPEDPEEYLAMGAIYLSKKTRWRFINKNISDPDIGFIVDGAMKEIQQQQPKWKGSLPEGYAAPDVDTMYLRRWIELISSIDSNGKYREVWSTLFERFLMMFPDQEEKSSGAFYTPHSIIELMTKTVSPKDGIIYDPCCGSGGLLAVSSSYITFSGESHSDISIFGQELVKDKAMVATMNMAIRGLDVTIHSGNTLYDDVFPELQVDYVITNPPFNLNWHPEALNNDDRWLYGIAPPSNANYAWLQHCIHKLKSNGVAAVIMPNGSLSSNIGSESEIRRRMIQADLVEMIVTLPSNLFYNTAISVSMWVIAKSKKDYIKNKVLFIDATGFGKMLTKRNRELTTDDIACLTNICHKWENTDPDYQDVCGLCRSVSLQEIADNNYSLLPSRYVGIVENETDDFSFDETMNFLTKTLAEQFAKNAELEQMIHQSFKDLGYDFR